MQGLVHALKSKTNEGWFRRVVVQDSVNFPARSEIDVTRRVVYKDLKVAWYTWASVLEAPVEEVHVVRTVLSLPVRGSQYAL